jgi:hypothetical protein
MIERVVFGLEDSAFAHDAYSVAGVESKHIKWDRNFEGKSLPTFITDRRILEYDYSHIPIENRFALLIESQGIMPRTYRKIETRLSDFRLVFTHSERLLQRFDNTRWIPGGGVWVGGTYAGGKVGLHKKSKNVSILSSNKLRTKLHRERFCIAKRFESIDIGVDVFRQKLGEKQRVSVFETLEDYRYSICIENYLDSRYFTEKILNALACGTVPIYLGARQISDYFDSDGIIEFHNFGDLKNRVLPMIGPDDYESRSAAIVANIEKSMAYSSIEDYIYRNYADQIHVNNSGCQVE